MPPRLVRLSSGAIILSLFFYMLGWTAEKSRDGYVLGVSMSMLVLRWIDLVAIHRPERDFWKRGSSAAGVADRRAPNGLLGRVKWFFFLWNNQRFATVP